MGTLSHNLSFREGGPMLTYQHLANCELPTVTYLKGADHASGVDHVVLLGRTVAKTSQLVQIQRPTSYLAEKNVICTFSQIE